MPGGDRTGPMGRGPISGRGAGYCASNRAPGFMNRFFGRGSGTRVRWSQGGNRGSFGWRDVFRGAGFSRGLGSRLGYGRQHGAAAWKRFGVGGYAGQSKVNAGEEKQFLENRVRILKSELDVLQKRLNDLGSGDTE